ncbi:MAG: Ig-like domain-containing protein [Patescibacteria group bacterium]|jgi:hypothetical protein|nr:Ig-like domain-containing protein [Patescibacteria group bacterium]
MKGKIKFLVLFFGILAFFFIANTSLAQTNQTNDYGVQKVGEQLDGRLGETQDVRVTVVRFIQLALSFLGIIAVIIILYAGFLWMTSGGNEEKIARAKKILINAVIGLVIILSAWTIATYLINRISGITGEGGGSGLVYDTPPTGFYNPGAGAIGVCSVQSTYPEHKQKDVARNSSIMIMFKEEVDLNSICIDNAGTSCACDNDVCNKLNPEVIKIYKTDFGDACGSGTCPNNDANTNVTDVLVSVPSSNKTLVLKPLNNLGSSDGYTPYTVNFSERIKKLDGDSIFRGCSSNYLEINFTVSNVLDLSPPQIIDGGVFPPPDNEKDYVGEDNPAQAASAEIKVNSCPQKYNSASIISVKDGEGQSENFEVNISDYSGEIDKFEISVPTDSENKAQLFNGNTGALLGVTDFVNNEAYFNDFDLTLTVDEHPEGSFWEIEIMTEKLADSLRINSSVYIFYDSSVNNKIEVVENCNSNSNEDLATQATKIKAIISGNSSIEIMESEDSSLISLEAKVAGSSGNNIALEFEGSEAISVTPFSGGVDSDSTSQINKKEDKPRNSALQINFNEAINPVTVSGTAEEVSKAIKLVNYNSQAGGSNDQCSANSDCLSYKCENSRCIGDFVNGSYTLSSDYETVEFVSDNECGVNGCGEVIYCLPANSHLKVEINAANLKECSNDNNCAALSPYTSCTTNELNYNTCQDDEGNNYPSANLTNLDGVVDAAINSLDGNRNLYSDGPVNFYNQNNANIEDGDSYSYSFFITNDIKLDPPKIISISPSQGGEGVKPSKNIDIRFNSLILNNTLRSGDVDIESGDNIFNHKYINLKSGSPAAFGFWIRSENIDTEPMDGEPDLSIASINHTPLPESMTFYSQVGSGVKDIYQNCYKPAVGPGCSQIDASCCFGNNTNVLDLDQDGNCIIE